MNNRPSVVANTSVQVYALAFLILGGGIGAVFGFQVGAASDGSYRDLTIVPEAPAPKTFNWLLFEIGLCAGLISCAVLLAASFRAPTSHSD